MSSCCRPPGTRGIRRQAATAEAEDGRRAVEPGVLSQHVSGEGQSRVCQVEACGSSGLLVYNRSCFLTNTRLGGGRYGFVVEHFVQPPLEGHGDRRQRRFSDDSIANEVAHQILRLRHTVGVPHQLRPRGLGGVVVGFIYSSASLSAPTVVAHDAEGELELLLLRQRDVDTVDHLLRFTSPSRLPLPGPSATALPAPTATSLPPRASSGLSSRCGRPVAAA